MKTIFLLLLTQPALAAVTTAQARTYADGTLVPALIANGNTGVHVGCFNVGTPAEFCKVFYDDGGPAFTYVDREAQLANIRTQLKALDDKMRLHTATVAEMQDDLHAIHMILVELLKIQ